jgi:hypothetical protein
MDQKIKRDRRDIRASDIHGVGAQGNDGTTIEDKGLSREVVGLTSEVPGLISEMRG